MIVGIVGKPNTGKSTFFSAITMIPVAIENRPFTTIKPNRGIGFLRMNCVCRELGVKDQPKNSACIDSIRLIPVELIDCAGLVPGAWEGKGLGNFFLDEIRKADALIHIIDSSGSTDENGVMCRPGTRDPIEDLKFLEKEITMWLYQIIMKDWNNVIRRVKIKDDLINLLTEKLSGLSINRIHIIDSLTHNDLNVDKPNLWKDEDVINFASRVLKKSKPMIIAANKIDLPTGVENFKRLKEMGYKVMPSCAEAELLLRRATEKGLIEYIPGSSSFKIMKPESLTESQKNALQAVEKILEDWGTTGIQEILNSAFFDTLEMIAIFPVEDVEKLSDHDGRVLPDVHIVPKDTNAKQFAYNIHTDLGQGFLYAIDARTKKRLGENYILNNRDVIKIVSTKARI